MNKILNYIKLPLRNIIRYRRNHYIMIAIGFAAFMIVLIAGMISGIKNQLADLMYTNYTGDLMLIKKDVKIKESPGFVQVAWDKMLSDEGQIAALKRDTNIDEIYKRLTLMAGIKGGDVEKNQYVTVIGCDFAKEEDYSFRTLLDFTQQNNNLENGIYISKSIADKLNLEINTTVNLFFFTDTGPVSAKFKVAGIFTGKGYPGIVNSLVYIDYSLLVEKLMAGESKFSYLLISFKDKELAQQSLTGIAKNLPSDWAMVPPEISGKFILSQGEMYDVILSFTKGLMYLSIFLFIYSTLIISITGRKQEFGIMASMGIKKGNIFALFATEGVLLGLLPALTGCILGLSAVGILSKIGIPAINEAMKYGIASDILYFKIDLKTATYTIIGVTVIAFLGTISPIGKILGLNPIDTLKSSW